MEGPATSRPGVSGISQGQTASQREVDLLNATVFGVQGQGGLLRELEGLRRQIRRNSQAIVFGALTMASALVALAAVVANHA